MSPTRGGVIREETRVNETNVTLHGYVGSPVKLRPAGDQVVASFRLGCTPSRYQRTTNTWTDEETQWFTVVAWRALADNCDASLRVGDAVVVNGRMSLKVWADANGVEQRTWEVTATSVGHDLNRGTSRYTKPQRYAEPPPIGVEPEGLPPDAEPVDESTLPPDPAEVAA